MTIIHRIISGYIRTKQVKFNTKKKKKMNYSLSVSFTSSIDKSPIYTKTRIPYSNTAYRQKNRQNPSPHNPLNFAVSRLIGSQHKTAPHGVRLSYRGLLIGRQRWTMTNGWGDTVVSGMERAIRVRLRE